MKFIAEINVMPLKALLDPQGKAVNATLKNTGYKTVSNVRIGKHITVELEADSRAVAGKQIDEICKKVLSNPIMESFEYEIKEI